MLENNKIRNTSTNIRKKRKEACLKRPKTSLTDFLSLFREKKRKRGRGRGVMPYKMQSNAKLSV